MYEHFMNASSNHQTFYDNHSYQSYNYVEPATTSYTNLNSGERIVNEDFDGFTSNFALEELNQNDANKLLDSFTSEDVVYHELTNVNTSTQSSDKDERVVKSNEPLPSDHEFSCENRSSLTRQVYKDTSRKVRINSYFAHKQMFTMFFFQMHC